MLILGNRSVICIFQSLFTYLMPVSRLPLQRVYAGSTSLFEYPIGPFLLFRACALSSRRLPSSSSDHFSESLRQSCTSTLFITIFPSLCTLSCRLLFPLCTLLRLSVCVSSASLPCLTGFPVTSSTGYFFTGPLFPLATLSSCDLHCGVPEISAPFVIPLYDRTSPAFCP